MKIKFKTKEMLELFVLQEVRGICLVNDEHLTVDTNDNQTFDPVVVGWYDGQIIPKQ